MTGSTSDGKPADAALVSTRANTAAAMGFKLSHRRRAFLADVFDTLSTDPKFRDKLLKQAAEDPKGFVGWLGSQLPADPTQAPSNPGAGNPLLSIGQLFLSAARGDPAPALALPIVDAEAVAVERDDW
jgi:hypothetical protein